MSDHAAFSYAPGASLYGRSYSRASVATYTSSVSDQAFAWWPGQTYNAETFTRASVATYTTETRYPTE